MTKRKLNEHGFEHSNALLEQYIVGDVVIEGVGHFTGKALKWNQKAAARSGMSEFMNTAGAKRHRQHLLICLEGGAVRHELAVYLADTAPVVEKV